jgi:hypothetical protein
MAECVATEDLSGTWSTRKALAFVIGFSAMGWLLPGLFFASVF